MELTSEQEDLVLEAGRQTRCESCKELFFEEDIDFIKTEGEDGLMVCRNCEADVKEGIR